MRTAAVVVTYNRKAMLEECLEHLFEQSIPCDVLLVDNASTDGTGEWAQAFARDHGHVFYRNTGSNTGGAGGFNFGMRWAVQAGYTHVWLMDDDTLPHQDALEQLLSADELLGGEYGFLSSVTLWTDGRECRMNRQKLSGSVFEHIHLLAQGLIAVKQATFVSCFFRTEMIEKAGLPIKEFFIWGDDIEYTRRMGVRMKLPCYLVGRSRVVHAMRSNSGSSIAKDDPERIERYNYAFRNENYLYRKEGLKGFAFYTAKCAVNLLRIVCSARNHRLRRCLIIIRQYVLGLGFNPRVEYVTAEEKHEI